ncbi:MAG TPA: hypothetical protein VFC19_32475 [Candidatus Limnocylindrales bacterium]|nr:hypothetical protein [Candidatus Limnocylindrales bacterium]
MWAWDVCCDFIAGNDAWIAKLAVGPGAPTPPPSPPAIPVAPALVSPADGATVTQPVTFDWSDVTGAASYTLQIDNGDTFSAPFTVEVTVATSQYTASGLPTQRMWWRVRANVSGGTPGNWSGARRFEIRN